MTQISSPTRSGKPRCARISRRSASDGRAGIGPARVSRRFAARPEISVGVIRLDCMAHGAEPSLNRHFDRSAFTRTLLLQTLEAGGAFEYRRDPCSAEVENIDGVARLPAGNDPDLRRLDLAPCTLIVFRGRNPAHRVTPVMGRGDRIIAVFSFHDHPGVRFSAQEQTGFYGRAA